MAQLIQREPTPPPEFPTDLEMWQYGWRYVPRTTQYGTAYDRVPLTLEEALNPEEGYQVVQSDLHQRRCTYLYNVFRARFAGDPHTVVLNDMLIRWDVPGIPPDAPDVAVIPNIKERKAWNSFDVATEGTRPSLIIEITSPTTRIHDLVEKTDDYFDAGVPLYVIADFSERRGTSVRRLIGHQFAINSYAPLLPNDRGWLWLAPVGLWLAIEEDLLVCYDQDEQPIEDYPEVVAAREEAEVRAEEAEQRIAEEVKARSEAEQRVAELEAELRRLRGEGG